MKPVYITKTASFLPNPPVGNDDMERILGQAGDRPLARGAWCCAAMASNRRHYAIDPETLSFTHNNAELAAEAVEMVGKSIDLEKVGVLACGTSVADQMMPGHAVMVQGELALPACEVVTTSGVCISGAAALKYAYMAVAIGEHEGAIAAGSELSSAMLGPRITRPKSIPRSTNLRTISNWRSKRTSYAGCSRTARARCCCKASPA